MLQIDAKSTTAVVRKRRTRLEWSQIMADYESSGRTQRNFCDERGVAYSSFCYWRKRLSHEDVSPLIELPVHLDAAEISGANGSAPDWRVELELGQGIIVRIR